MEKNVNVTINANLILVIIIIVLATIINNKNNEIEKIINTDYEFCYVVDNQEFCDYQKIGDYLNELN